MPTEHDFYEALIEGRWQPDIQMGIKVSGKDELFYAKYTQSDDLVVEKTSPWSPTQAEGDLMEELRQGTLEGKYFPIAG